MKEPFCSEAELLHRVHERRDLGSGTIKFIWLGQSGFLIKHGDRHLLIDPYLSDSLTKKYQDTDKPHARMMRRVSAREKRNFIDVVSSSHNHTDHLDPDTLRPLFAV